MGDKKIFKGSTLDQAKWNAVASGYMVVGTAFNKKKGYWVAFGRSGSDKMDLSKIL